MVVEVVGAVVVVFVVRTAFSILLNLCAVCGAICVVARFVCAPCFVYTLQTTIQKSRARPFMSAVIILFVAIFIYFNSHYYICYVRFMLFNVFVCRRRRSFLLLLLLLLHSLYCKQCRVLFAVYATSPPAIRS